MTITGKYATTKLSPIYAKVHSGCACCRMFPTINVKDIIDNILIAAALVVMYLPVKICSETQACNWSFI